MDTSVNIKKFNELGKQFEDKLKPRTHPIAVKFCETLDEVPTNAIWPKKDLGKRAAFCQATAMARFKGQTVAMAKEDHWCWNPLVAFGLCKAEVGEPAGDTIVEVLGIKDKEQAEAFWANFPRLELGKYPYVVVGPIADCTFEPNVVLIYSNTLQIVWEIGAIRFMTGNYVDSTFDSIDSCIHSILNPWRENKYRITFPDPGDRARALAREDEVILTVPAKRWEEFCEGIEKTEFMYTRLPLEIGIELENEVPPFYHQLFKIWGLE